jgi:hypothetical protein
VQITEPALRTAEQERALDVADVAVDRVGEAVRLEVAVAASLLERVEHLDDLAALDGVVVHGAQARSAVAAARDALGRVLRSVVAQEHDRDDRERRRGGDRG